MNRAVGGVSDGEACLESFFSAMFLPLILPVYALTCCYKPCGRPCWWGDAPCTEHRVTPQYARGPAGVLRDESTPRWTRRMTGRMTVSTDARARGMRRDETNAQTTAGTAKRPPRARALRARAESGSAADRLERARLRVFFTLKKKNKVIRGRNLSYP